MKITYDFIHWSVLRIYLFPKQKGQQNQNKHSFYFFMCLTSSTSSKISSLRSGSLFNFASPWLSISSLTSEKLKQYQHHHAFIILHNQSFRNNLFVSTKNQSSTTGQLKTSFLQSNWLVTFTNILCTMASQYKYAKNNVQIRGID